MLLAGWHLGLMPALVAAVAGVLWSGYFFFSPFYSFYLARPNEILNLVLFMVVAVVTSHLANSMKQQTEIARKREKEMSDLYAFSRRLAGALGRGYLPRDRGAPRQPGPAQGGAVRRRQPRSTAGDAESDRTQCRSACAPRSPRCRTAARRRPRWTTAPAISGWSGACRRGTPTSASSPSTSAASRPAGVDDVRQRVDDVLSDAAATLERLDVARALNDAKMRSETELLREALIGSVSHELRTPLASILGAATVLSQSPAVAKDERLTSLAGVVRDEAERLNNDIQNLLDATRISREQIRPRQEWIEPQDIVNSALERRRRRLAGHHVALDMDSNLPFIYVDAVLVEQAFVQIVDNAAKYSAHGLADHDRRQAQRPRRGAVGPRLGVGLTAEENEQLGERFFRGARHVATTSGSGLGLWIAKAFVTANGGRIEAVSSGADRGTTVSIHLPYATPASQPEVGPDD